MSSGSEEAPDDLSLCAIAVHGRHEAAEALAEVVHLAVQALDVVARLLQKLGRGCLHEKESSRSTN